MGADYALVHVKYTIPPALFLTALYRPLQTHLDTCKIVFLLTIAVLSTIPWDSYLVSAGIWTYPPDAVLGYTLFKIPVEEVFFFFVQTYNTTMIYLLCNKATAHVAYLSEINEQANRWRVRRQRSIGAVVAAALAYGIVKAVGMVSSGGEGKYMGLLIAWAGPFVLTLWCIAYRHILSLPLRCTAFPILLPTVYLWGVDTLALRRGTWAISTGTKLGIEPWSGMEIEEAVFFLATNVLIVFGLVAFDYAVALTTAFPTLFPDIRSVTPFRTLFAYGARALFTRRFPRDEYCALPASIDILRRKSRSFYMASSVFEGRLRLDLISLYSFCRAADDLIDDAPEPARSLERLQQLLALMYDPKRSSVDLENFVHSMFPAWAHTPILSLPYTKIPRRPLEELLEGFHTDMTFPALDTEKKTWPIQTENDLHTYGHRVAGTVGEMFCHLVFYHSADVTTPTDLSDYLANALKMGIALQYVNIARDIAKDAQIGRVYIPATWLSQAGVTEQDVLDRPEDVAAEFGLRRRLLEAAEVMYAESRAAIEGLPLEARGGARVAVEGYMDIGRRMNAGRWKRGKIARMARAWWLMRG